MQHAANLIFVALLLRWGSALFVDTLELCTHIITGSVLRQRLCLFPYCWCLDLYACMCLTFPCSAAVLLGVTACQAFCLMLWWLAQHLEKVHRRRKMRINSALRASRFQPQATHTARRLSWSPPSMRTPSFWGSVATFTLLTLFFSPTMPTSPPPTLKSTLNPTLNPTFNPNLDPAVKPPMIPATILYGVDITPDIMYDPPAGPGVLAAEHW